MTAHAILSPSSADRWMTCPGSVYLEKDEPDTSSEYADEGTAAHHLAEMCLRMGCPAADFIGAGLVINEGAACVKCTDDMAVEVQKYLDYVRQVSAGSELFIEQTFDIGHVVPACFGTSDSTVLHADGELHVIDLKFGRGVEVSAVENKQMMLYALGAIEKFSLTHDVNRVRMTIHQPRLNNVSEWAISVEDLMQAAALFQQAGDRAIQFYDAVVPTPEDFAPSEKACQFCAARGSCEALAKFSVTTIADDFVDLTTVESTLPTIVDAANERIGQIDNTTLGHLMAHMDLIELWVKAVRARVETELLAGNAVYGHKLVEGRKGRRDWIDDQSVEETMKSMRLKKDEMYNYSVISPTQAEKLLKASPRKWDRIRDHITQSTGKPSVAPLDDPRPALVITPVADDFDDLTQTPTHDAQSVESLV